MLGGVTNFCVQGLAVSDENKNYFIVVHIKRQMALKYKDNISLHHDNTVCARRQEILQILEESKEMVYNLHSMVLQLNALKTRCQKIANPRKGPSYDKVKEQARYQQNRKHITEKLRHKRQKIRDIKTQGDHLMVGTA